MIYILYSIYFVFLFSSYRLGKSVLIVNEAETAKQDNMKYSGRANKVKDFVTNYFLMLERTRLQNSVMIPSNYSQRICFLKANSTLCSHQIIKAHFLKRRFYINILTDHPE